MTALPLRPALVDVLCAISVCDPEMDDDELRRLVAAFIGPHWPFCAVSHRWESGPLSCDWITRDPSEAFEALISRGVLPDSWAGDVRRFFRCRCDGVPIKAPARGGQAIPSCAMCEYYNAPGDPFRPEYAIPRPATIPALVSWASLGPAAILRAEELALHGARLLTIRPPVVVWRVAPLTPVPQDTMLWQVERQRKLCGEGVLAPCDALYEMGLAWVYADDHAVTIAVPPVGAP